MRRSQLVFSAVALVVIGIVSVWQSNAPTDTAVNLSESDGAARVTQRRASRDEVLDALDPPTSRASESVEVAHRYGSAHPDDFAGAFAAGDAVYVGFTANLDLHLTALRDQLGGVPLRVFTAPRNEQALLDIVRAIGAEMASARGHAIRDAGVDTRRNIVVVSVLQSGPDVAAEVRARYGDSVVVEMVPDGAHASDRRS